MAAIGLGVVVVAAIVLALAVAAVTALAVFGGMYLLRHAAPALGRAWREAPRRHDYAFEALPESILRRRYAAGEIGDAEFRRRLVDLLKERYVRGDLTLAEYEAQVARVLRAG